MGTVVFPDAAVKIYMDASPQIRAQRRAADPDGKFEWKGGVLKCPGRRHDFRLFEFWLKEEGAGKPSQPPR